MKSKIGNVLAMVIGLFSIPLYFFQEPLFSVLVPVWMWYYFIPSERVICPTIDAEFFRSKSIRTPTIEVKNYEECAEQGKRMGHPLICRGVDVPNDELVSAIVDDPKKYEYFCFHEECAKNILLNCREVSGIGDAAVDPSTLRSLREVSNMMGKNCYAGPIVDNSQNSRLRKIFDHLDEKIPVFGDGAGNKNITDHVEAGGSLHFPTSFVGNFEKGDIYTSAHAAMVASMVYQVEGRKVFLMYDHKATKHWTIYSKILHPWPTCTTDYVNGQESMWIAPLRPGDFLYFPPYWSHTVYSDEGLNVMTNIRLITLNNILYAGTYANALGVLATSAIGRKPWSRPYNQFLKHSYDIFDDANSTDVIRNILEEYLEDEDTSYWSHKVTNRD